MKRSISVCLFSCLLIALVPACQSAPEETPPTEAPPAETAAPPAVEGEVVATGTFEGRSDHAVSGRVSILATDDRFLLRLESDFSLDGAPAPAIGLGNNGYDASTRFSELKALTGEQVYDLPFDADEYDEVWIWCTKFDVPQGVATLIRN